MNNKIIFPLLTLTIIVIGTVFLFTSNILVLDTSQLQDITESEITLIEKTLLKSVDSVRYDINTKCELSMMAQLPPDGFYEKMQSLKELRASEWMDANNISPDQQLTDSQWEKYGIVMMKAALEGLNANPDLYEFYSNGINGKGFIIQAGELSPDEERKCIEYMKKYMEDLKENRPAYDIIIPENSPLN